MKVVQDSFTKYKTLLNEIKKEELKQVQGDTERISM